MTAFISGHLKIEQKEFLQRYMILIVNAIQADHNFVLGDARGVDAFAQEFLLVTLGENSPRVTVYHMFDSPRVNRGKFQTKGGFTSDEERDAAMTAASDYDIAWVRPGRETSGTAKNLQRRFLSRTK
jgi:hypothetical protein